MKRVLVATLSLLHWLAAEARAQEPEEVSPPREPDVEEFTVQQFTPEEVQEEFRRDTALVVSGGISLGSYQAGFLYYFLEYMKRRRVAERVVDANLSASPFSVATGASAGSINASLAAMESCRKPQPDPTQSVFYQTWIPVGIDELYTNGKSVSRISLFSRKPIDDAALRLKEYVNSPSDWLDAECGVDIGMVTTRLEARAVKLRVDRPTLEAPRMTEKFALQFHKPANERAGFRQLVPQAKLSNPEVKAMSEFLLRPGHDPEQVEFSTFAKLLKASSSFPLAFEPVQVPYQVPGSTERASDDFIDGGVFENVPVRLATKVLALQALAKGDRTSTRPRNMNYVVVDSDVLSWKRAEKTSKKGDGLLSLLQSFAGDFVAAASSTELLSAIEDEPELRSEKGGLIMAERRSMLASDHLYAFSGFFDKRFRLLDFYLGMLDARNFAKQPYWLESDKTRSGDSLVPGVDASIQSEIFQCFIRLDEASDGMDMPVGLERAAKLCNLGAGTAQAKGDNAELLQLAILFDAAISVKNFATSRLSEGKEAEFDRWLGHLDASGFKFRVFGENIEPADFKLWLRERVGGMLDQLASKQPENGFVISDGGSVALNGLLHYVEPLSLWGLGVHLNRGLDMEYGYGRKYRFGIAARLRYFSAIKALQGEELTATPFAVGTFAWVHRIRPLCGQCGFELGADLGAGYRWLSRGAETEEFGADPGGRDHPEGFVMAAGPAVTLTFLQRAYAKLDNHYFWSLKELDLGHPAITAGLGLGWRFH